MDNIDERKTDIAEEAQETAQEPGRRRGRLFWAVAGRIFLFCFVTGMILGLTGLTLEYILLRGPSPALKETFVLTMLESRRFDFVPRIFLSREEVDAIRDKGVQTIDEEMDASLISIASRPETGESSGESPGAGRTDRYGLEDEDGDGVILEEIYGTGYVGYMLTVLDPTRVFVGKPDSYGGEGLRLDQMIDKYGASGGINGGAFQDTGWVGRGGIPAGLTIIDGVCYSESENWSSFVGFDADGLMHVGQFSRSTAESLGIVNGVSFGPVLVYNGEAASANVLSSGVSPRTAIGQRADGAVLMLVIDGRQAHSPGATYQDLADIMLSHGAVNACNLDGGSSTTMYFQGEYVNSCSSASGTPRQLPTAFLFK